MRVELEPTDEVQDMARIKEEVTKLRAARRYNTKVQPWTFQLGEPFNLVTSYGKSKVKPQKIPKHESLAPTRTTHSGSQQALTMKHTNYKNWMIKQFQEHGRPPT